jgi:hypothetical protein
MHIGKNRYLGTSVKETIPDKDTENLNFCGFSPIQFKSFPDER